jgi:simple sugar transport system ATP-binding protein/D-xylose transport system ATP-binding protein
VLNLIERLRERGLGVIMISHNMADVKAVADRVAVLRLGRNNGVFDAEATSAEELVAAITGATDNVVSRRSRRARPSGGESDPEDGAGADAEPAADEQVPTTAMTKGDGDE